MTNIIGSVVSSSATALENVLAFAAATAAQERREQERAALLRSKGMSREEEAALDARLLAAETARAEAARAMVASASGRRRDALAHERQERASAEALARAERTLLADATELRNGARRLTLDAQARVREIQADITRLKMTLRTIGGPVAEQVRALIRGGYAAIESLWDGAAEAQEQVAVTVSALPVTVQDALTGVQDIREAQISKRAQARANRAKRDERDAKWLARRVRAEERAAALTPEEKALRLAAFATRDSRLRAEAATAVASIPGAPAPSSGKAAVMAVRAQVRALAGASGVCPCGVAPDEHRAIHGAARAAHEHAHVRRAVRARLGLSEKQG